MSAFFVGNTQVSRLANFIYEEGWKLDNKLVESLQIVVGKEFPMRLARALYGMNVDALRQRYPEMWEEMVKPFEYLPSERYPDDFQAYKSMQCYEYQCFEGNVPKTKLFIIMKQFGNALAHRLAMNIADAKGARWE